MTEPGDGRGRSGACGAPRTFGWQTIAIFVAAALVLVLVSLGKPTPKGATPPETDDAWRTEALLETAASNLEYFELALIGLGLATLCALIVPRVRMWLFPPPRMAPRTSWSAIAIAQSVALALLMIFIAAEAGARWFPDGPTGSFLAYASAQLGLGVALLPALSAPGGASSLGLSAKGWTDNLLRGTVAYLAALPVSAAAAEYARIVEGLTGGEAAPPHPVIREIASAGTYGTILLVIATCVLAPFFEELFFRGFLYAAIRDRWGLGAGLAVSSLLFASVHPGLPNQAATATLGLVLAAAYERGGTLFVPVTAHALFNGVQLGSLLIAKSLCV